MHSGVNCDVHVYGTTLAAPPPPQWPTSPPPKKNPTNFTVKVVLTLLCPPPTVIASPFPPPPRSSQLDSPPVRLVKFMHRCPVGKSTIKSRRDLWVVGLENTVLRCFWWVAEGQDDQNMTRKQPLVGYFAVLLVGCGDRGGFSVLTDGIWRDMEERCRWRWRHDVVGISFEKNLTTLPPVTFIPPRHPIIF